jgi:aerobic carbon-monoxide dehydrogenase medium subunit
LARDLQTGGQRKLYQEASLTLTAPGQLHVAQTVQEAVAVLAERGPDATPLAGATWVMRAPLRQERPAPLYVALTKIDSLRDVMIDDREVSIGACVTHAELVRQLASLPDCKALASAAGSAANPAIRQVATIGGNLCAQGFAAADLVPALLCLDAEVELQAPGGTERLAVSRFLALRASSEPGQIVRRVIVPRAQRRSAHIRLPLRKAGDYPVAIVSLAVTLDASGRVDGIRAAVGSVEPTARRWHELEADLIGHPLDPVRAADKAAGHGGVFRARDGIEAPGWYRVKVIPSLVRSAVRALQAQT